MSLSADDIAEITQLYGRYAHAVDAGDGKAFAACFTPEGALRLGDGEPLAGHDAIAEFASSMPTMVPGIRHSVSNIVLDGNGEEATGAAYLLVYLSGSETTIITTGRYRDELRRDDGSWAFASRVFLADA
jgi:uncharacterized protein (TIGR02246 family)